MIQHFHVFFYTFSLITYKVQFYYIIYLNAINHHELHFKAIAHNKFMVDKILNEFQCLRNKQLLQLSTSNKSLVLL